MGFFPTQAGAGAARRARSAHRAACASRHKGATPPNADASVECEVWDDNSLSETSDVIESAASAEEAEFFAKAFDIILQQKQKNVVAEKRF